MRRSFRNPNTGIAATFVLAALLGTSLGCDTFLGNGFLGLDTCDVLNCDGLLFGAYAEDHDEGPEESAEDAELADGHTERIRLPRRAQNGENH